MPVRNPNAPQTPGSSNTAGAQSTDPGNPLSAAARNGKAPSLPPDFVPPATIPGEFARAVTDDGQRLIIFSRQVNLDSSVFVFAQVVNVNGKYEGTGLYARQFQDNFDEGVAFHFDDQTRQMTATFADGEQRALTIQPSHPLDKNLNLSFKFFKDDGQDGILVTNSFNGLVFSYSFGRIRSAMLSSEIPFWPFLFPTALRS